jgi:hypothetical protein
MFSGSYGYSPAMVSLLVANNWDSRDILDQPGSKISSSCRTAGWRREQLDSVPEASQFADHLARPHFLGLDADRWPAFFIADALVAQLPNQTAQAMGDGADRPRGRRSNYSAEHYTGQQPFAPPHRRSSVMDDDGSLRG